MLQLQLANSHSSWGQVLSDCYIKTAELLKSRTHLTSLTSLMCGMCRITTWPSLGSQYESPNRGSMRHNTTVPAERSVKWRTVFRISILLPAQKNIFAKSFHNATRTIFPTRCKTIPTRHDELVQRNFKVKNGTQKWRLRLICSKVQESEQFDKAGFWLKNKRWHDWPSRTISIELDSEENTCENGASENKLQSVKTTTHPEWIQCTLHGPICTYWRCECVHQGIITAAAKGI